MASAVYATAVNATITAGSKTVEGQILGFDENLFFVSGAGEQIIGMGISKPIICAHCSLPVAEMVGASLLISARHHGEQHRTLIPLDMIANAKEDITVLR